MANHVRFTAKGGHFIADVNHRLGCTLRRRSFRRNWRTARQNAVQKNRCDGQGVIALQRARPWCAVLIGLALTSATYAAPLRDEPRSASHHFVDFRARSGGAAGHTYVIFGNIDDRGRILSARVAGFYPRGELSQSVFSVLMPMPGYIGSEPADRAVAPSAIYRRRLNADAYARLVTTVESLRKTQPTWRVLFFNCNAFAAETARSIGLRVPPTLEFPNEFVYGLYSMNRPTSVTPVHYSQDRKSE